MSLICGCMPSMAFIFLATSTRRLSIVKSLQDSSGQGFLNIFDGSGLSNSSGFVILGPELEGGVQFTLKGGDELSIGHRLKSGHVFLMLLDESDADWGVMVVVAGGGRGNEE